MSYSFTIRAATKAEAKEKVAADFDKVVAAQPDHATDREQALSAATAFIDMLVDDETRDVVVSVNGWLNWSEPSLPRAYSGACVGVSASLSTREVAVA